jgi:hypothetical protein
MKNNIDALRNNKMKPRVALNNSNKTSHEKNEDSGLKSTETNHEFTIPQLNNLDKYFDTNTENQEALITKKISQWFESQTHKKMTDRNSKKVCNWIKRNFAYNFDQFDNLLDELVILRKFELTEQMQRLSRFDLGVGKKSYCILKKRTRIL